MSKKILAAVLVFFMLFVCTGCAERNIEITVGETGLASDLPPAIVGQRTHTETEQRLRTAAEGFAASYISGDTETLNLFCNDEQLTILSMDKASVEALAVKIEDKLFDGSASISKENKEAIVSFVKKAKSARDCCISGIDAENKTVMLTVSLLSDENILLMFDNESPLKAVNGTYVKDDEYTEISDYETLADVPDELMPVLLPIILKRLETRLYFQERYEKVIILRYDDDFSLTAVQQIVT